MTMKEKSKLKWLRGHIGHIESYSDMSAKTVEILLRLAEKSGDPNLTIKILQAIAIVGRVKFDKEMRRLGKYRRVRNRITSKRLSEEDEKKILAIAEREKWIFPDEPVENANQKIQNSTLLTDRKSVV